MNTSDFDAQTDHYPLVDWATVEPEVAAAVAAQDEPSAEEIRALARTTLPADLLAVVGDSLNSAVAAFDPDLHAFVAATTCTVDWGKFFRTSFTTMLLEPNKDQFDRAWSILARHGVPDTEASFGPVTADPSLRPAHGKAAVVVDVIYVPAGISDSEITEISAMFGDPWVGCFDGRSAWCPLA